MIGIMRPGLTWRRMPHCRDVRQAAGRSWSSFRLSTHRQWPLKVLPTGEKLWSWAGRESTGTWKMISSGNSSSITGKIDPPGSRTEFWACPQLLGKLKVRLAHVKTKCGTDLHQEKDVIVQAELNLLWRWGTGWLDKVLHNLLSRCKTWDKPWEITKGLCTEGFPANSVRFPSLIWFGAEIAFFLCVLVRIFTIKPRTNVY